MNTKKSMYYIIAAIQHPTAASDFLSCGISISRLPAPHSNAMYTNTGTATADMTVQIEAQQLFNDSDSMEKSFELDVP